MTYRHAPLLALIAASCWAPAQADPVTSVDPGIDARVITFSPYNAFTTAAVPALASTDVGTAEGFESVLLSFSDDSSERILGAVPTDLGSNGAWPLNSAFAGLNAASGNMNFRFSRGMNFVGGFVNYRPNAFDGSVTLAALDLYGNEIESDVLAYTDAAGSGQGEFRGFASSGADIWGFALSNGQVVIDNLTFGTNAISVPEPTSIALALVALGALGASRRRR